MVLLDPLVKYTEHHMILPKLISYYVPN